VDPGTSLDVATALQISATMYNQIMTVPYSECLHLLSSFCNRNWKKRSLSITVQLK